MDLLVSPWIEIAYGLIALPLWRMFGGHFAWTMQNNMPTGGTLDAADIIFGGILGGAVAAAVWPAVLLLMLGIALLPATVRRVPVPKIGAEARAAAAQREARIAQLEKELKLR